MQNKTWRTLAALGRRQQPGIAAWAPDTHWLGLPLPSKPDLHLPKTARSYITAWFLLGPRQTGSACLHSRQASACLLPVLNLAWSCPPRPGPFAASSGTKPFFLGQAIVAAQITSALQARGGPSQTLPRRQQSFPVNKPLVSHLWSWLKAVVLHVALKFTIPTILSLPRQAGNVPQPCQTSWEYS